MMEENKQSKLKQKKLLIITVITLGGIIMVFLSSGPKKPAHDLAKTIAESKNKIILQDPNHGLKAEDRWLYDAEAKLDEYGNFQKEYAADKGGMESRLAEVEKKYEESLGVQTGLIEAQGQEIQALKSQLSAPKPVSNQVANQQDTFGTNQTGGPNGEVNSMALPRNIQTTNLELEKTVNEQGEFFKTSEYVPAGAYAQAVIISGVDASVGAAAQSDPRPVLLRIKGPAVSSIYDGNNQETDLKGCLITGAASGDLSSEKVYVKLVNMTCSKSEDLVYETAIKGYVAGQGKSGVRGNVISRAGDIVTKSFLAGLIGGLGQGLSAKVAPPLNFSNGLTTQGTMSTEDVAKKGLGQGISNSGDRLANYFINRAEQYQPVVSIPSGIDVEVVFVEGFYLSGKAHRNATAPTNKLVNKFEGQ
jgi:conjugal transfer pilus assembly protein TraB